MKIAIVGKGAMGLLFGSIAQEHLGAEDVCFVMDDARFDKHAHETYTINGAAVHFNDVRARDAQPADLVLVGTKSLALPAALDVIKPLVGPDTAIVPMLNGIRSESVCAQRFGWEHVVACVAAGMDAQRYGNELLYSKVGYLAIGALDDASAEAVEHAAAVFEEAGIPYRIDEDIEHWRWVKFMSNVGVNQVCAAFGMCYEDLFADETSEAYRTFLGAMREVIAVARAEGVDVTEDDLNHYLGVLLSLDPKSRPSTAQDVLNRVPTEVDEFAGEVIRRAESHDIQAPCNRFLLKRIREIEAAY